MKSSKELTALLAARKIIANLKHFGQYHYTSNKHGELVQPQKAVRFCALGALHKACNYRLGDSGENSQLVDNVDILLTIASGTLFNEHCLTVNDMGSRKYAHLRVLKIYDKAIKNAKERLGNATISRC
jgi:hypothetical protein